MKFEFLREKTQNLIVLNKTLLQTLEPKRDVLDFNIKYWLKRDKLISLKKGQYILAEKLSNQQYGDGLLEYLAGEMVKPTYLSLEYVLAKYQVLSEPVQGLTSVTTKKTREIKNDLGVFRYYSITERLFCGYRVKKQGELVWLEAELPKALFDFLYFRFLKEQSVSLEAVDNLRLNWENISKKDFWKAKKYLQFTNSQRLRKLFIIIEKEFYV